MSQDPSTACRRVAFASADGRLLRPTGTIVRLADAFQADIHLECQGIRANGKSILDLVVLIAECGPTFACALEARGPDAEKAVAVLADLIVIGLNESEEGGTGATLPGAEDGRVTGTG